jgi:hypothetical protein
MTIGFPVTPDRLKVIMAGVHPGDGTTRPQTVSRTVSPLYWELLDRVNKLTGVPGLLNTSFNRLGPIVETPEDALNTFYYCDGLDMLAIGHFLVQRRDSYRPSILNARDEASLGALFRTAQMQREPLTEAWDVFWTTAGTLADSTRRQNQGYLAIYAHTSRGEEELLRVPLIKEIFQTGTREAILGDICERIARKVGMQMPVTISVETTLRQFSRVIFDLFNNFLSRRGWTSWNLVSLGNAERRYFPPNGPLSLIKASEAIQRIEQTSQHSGDIQLIALTGPDISTRRLIVEHLQKDAGPRIWHIDGARWEKDQSQRNTALSYPFSQFDVPRFIRTMQRLRAGQSAMIPVRAPIPGAAASRGYASFSNDNAEVPRSLVTKPDSSLWIRHDAKVFEELRPAGGDIILVNAHVALNFPSTREAFSDSYYVASQFQVIDNTRGGVAIDSAFAQVWPHAHNIVISVDSDG